METDTLFYNFLVKEFPIKRVKNNLHKWERSIVVDGGLVRSKKRIYRYQHGLEVHLIFTDLIKTLQDVFSCTKDEATKCVTRYVETLEV